MGLTGHRRTSSHKRRRAAHFALDKSPMTTCKHCKTQVPPHQVCSNCGYYKGREVVKMATILDRITDKKAEPVKAKK